MAGFALSGLVLAGCAMLVDPSATPRGADLDPASPAAEPADPPSAVPAAPKPPTAGSESAFGEVPLPQGSSLWISDTDIHFAVERTGDEVLTARAGMGNPKCFYGVVAEGVLLGRYRAVTAGEGLDRQAEPVRVAQSGVVVTFTERGTGTVLGEYYPIDPADSDSITVASKALEDCRAMRSAPATAGPS
jgi:hypothetical protein